jgi:hypothetical protein
MSHNSLVLTARSIVHLAQDIRIITEEEEVTYVEVKSTIAADKPFFEVSMPELLFGLHSGAAYHIYRVSAACSADATITCIKDLEVALANGMVSLAILTAGKGK